MQRRASPARDADELLDRLQRAAGLVADVRDQRRADARRLLRDQLQLAGGGVEAGQVDHPERERAGAGVEAVADRAAHPLQLGGVGRAVLGADHVVAHRTVADRGDERRRRAGRGERVEVLGEARPAPLRRARSLQSDEVGAAVVAPRRLDRRRRKPVGVQQLGR